MPGCRVTRRAQQDIREIGQYTQDRYGQEQRRRYLAGMAEWFARSAENPDLAVERTELEPPVRIHRYERHMIVYRREEAGILIIRALHGSMDGPARLSDR